MGRVIYCGNCHKRISHAHGAACAPDCKIKFDTDCCAKTVACHRQGDTYKPVGPQAVFDSLVGQLK